MEEDEFLGCISCMNVNDLYDLFAVYEDNGETYASMLETCFEIKVPENVKYLCSDCAELLEKAVVFKRRTNKSISMLKEALTQDEEYLDESILEQADAITEDNHEDNLELKRESDDEENDIDDQFEPPSPQDCKICGLSVDNMEQHLERCHTPKAEATNRKYPCHFCNNIYISKRACFTHLRMKHGLKLCTEQPPKIVQRERKKCHLCNRDFSQKQILNKHLLKVHGLEVEKRKAFSCPLCPERVSYGSQFSAHLLHVHDVHQQVDTLQFRNMDDFLLYKSAIQEETKYRFRKTTASKQTIEGVRSHYMCSQSGVYVCQGKGKRPAPERQIYKTGKACPAHMIVTETMESVLVTFYKTHVGHGPCPYFAPREPKKPKLEQPSTSYVLNDADEEITDDAADWSLCESCGAVCGEGEGHQHAHSQPLPCHYCQHDFQDLDAWTHHIQVDHNMVVY